MPRYVCLRGEVNQETLAASGRFDVTDGWGRVWACWEAPRGTHREVFEAARDGIANGELRIIECRDVAALRGWLDRGPGQN